MLGASVGRVTYVALYLLKACIMKFYIEGQALGAVQTPVSYTHLDVYKRQGWSCARTPRS